MFRRPTAASLRTPEIVGEVTNPVMKQSVVSGGERSIEFCDCMVLCSALSRLRASSTHASGKLAIEAASRFLIRPRLEFSYTGRKRRASDIDRPALLSDNTTLEPFGGER